MYTSYRQTREYGDFLTRVGWQVEQNEHMYGFIKRLGPVSILKLQRVPVDSLSWTWISSLQKEYRVVSTYIEPNTYSHAPLPTNEVLLTHGYAVATDFMIPTKSRIIDIRQPEAELIERMKPKTRYNLRLAQRNQLKAFVYTGTQLVADQALFAQYYQMLQDNARRVRMLLVSRVWIYEQLRAFGDAAYVVFIYSKEQKMVAVTTYFTSPDSVFYTHNGSTTLGRQQMAPTLAVWAGINEAKRRHKQVFDFDGIFDDRRPRPRWLGYTRFKAGFGGEEVYFDLMYRQRRWPFGG